MKNDMQITDSVPARGFSTRFSVSIVIEAPIEKVFEAVTDIRGNSRFFPTTEFRFDGEYPIKTGDYYYTREVGTSSWSTYQFVAVEKNRRMSGELVKDGGIFKRMRYNHEFIPHEHAGWCISRETLDYTLSYGPLGSFANWIYGKSKAKQTLISAHQQLKRFLETSSAENLLDAPATLSASDIFMQYTLEGSNWEEIKSKFVTNASDNNEGAFFSLDNMRTMVRYRDVLDFGIYKRVIESLFPIEYFDVTPEVCGGMREEPDATKSTGCCCIYKTTKYNYTVRNKQMQMERDEYCQITINSPGSRTLTSDIDTAIFVSSTALFDFRHALPRVSEKGPDYDGRVVNALIDGFYTTSQALHGITSGESRDSNVYADTRTNDSEEYPKFNDTEVNNPIVSGKKLFSTDEFKRLFSRYKLVKHWLELSASLFSLRCSLDDASWIGFKLLVLNRVAELSAVMFNRADAPAEVMRSDLDVIFSFTERYFIEYRDELESELGRVMESEYAKQSPFSKGSPAFKKDMQISAMNALYVRYLEETTTVNGEILGLKTYVKEALLKDQREPSTRQDIENLKKFFIIIARLKNKKQALRVKAHTFANGGYVNRSAIYHIVKGMQEGVHVRVSEQTLLGSALHQIGFRVLYAKEQRAKGKTEGEIFYSNGKYGARVFDLIFACHRDEVDEAPIESCEMILHHLKSANIKPVLNRLFSRDELLFLKYEMNLVTSIKRSSIPESERPLRAHKLLGERLHAMKGERFGSNYEATDSDITQFACQDEEPLLLSMASKLIVVVYLSQLTRKNAIWGGLRPSVEHSGSMGVGSVERTEIDIIGLFDYILKSTAESTYPKHTTPEENYFMRGCMAQVFRASHFEESKVESNEAFQAIFGQRQV